MADRGRPRADRRLAAFAALNFGRTHEGPVPSRGTGPSWLGLRTDPRGQAFGRLPWLALFLARARRLRAFFAMTAMVPDGLRAPWRSSRKVAPMSVPGLHVENDGRVLRLLLDRPERRHALNDAVLEGLIAHVAEPGDA